ncbi:hypothetical protein [Ahniella affigens]|nr:hypothetical protein [Ahniella affigens]
MLTAIAPLTSLNRMWNQANPKELPIAMQVVWLCGYIDSHARGCPVKARN